jgi:SAM-dependent methyltransferase
MLHPTPIMFAFRQNRLWQGLFARRLVSAVTGHRPSRDAGHFQRLYDANADPWHFRTSAYEQAKYQKSLEVLPGRRFRSAFEIGCSIGIFTKLLAPRCDALLGVDIVEQPLQAARTECSEQPWVRFQQMRVPDEWPNETFDLIVMSEVLYFLSRRDVAAVAERVCASLDANGLVMLVNWRGRSGDPCTGDEAAALFIERSAARLETHAQYREERYRLDLLGPLRSGAEPAIQR